MRWREHGCHAPEQKIEKALGFSITKRVHTGVATSATQGEATMTTHHIPATKTNWGFTGTLNEQAEAAWPIAMTAISDAT
jgi:hypothetical protein